MKDQEIEALRRLAKSWNNLNASFMFIPGKWLHCSGANGSSCFEVCGC